MILEPIDAVHADCLAARREINAQVHHIRTQIHAWQPKPCTPHPDTTRNGETK